MTGKERILLLLANGKTFGLTDEEIAATLDMNPSSARTRRCELEQEGLVIPVGLSTTKSGRKTFLWTAAANVKGKRK